MALLCVSGWLRFHGLTAARGYIFDEVYFARFAQDYLTFSECPEFMKEGGYPEDAGCFDVHPPLGKLLIALGQSFYPHTDFQRHESKESAPARRQGPRGSAPLPARFSAQEVLAWRILPAAFGVALVFVFYVLGTLLFDDERWGLLAAALASLDTLLLTHSRMATLDVFLLFFIGVALAAFLAGERWRARSQALRFFTSRSPRRRHVVGAYVVAGVGVGLAAGVKVAGFALLGVFLVSGVVRRWGRKRRLLEFGSVWAATLGLSLAAFVATLYLPRLIFSHPFPWDTDLLSKLSFHVGITARPHGTSPFYVWPLAGGAVVYYRELFYNGREALQSAAFIVATGNPVLWWWSTGALLTLLGGSCVRLFRGEQNRREIGRLDKGGGALLLAGMVCFWGPWVVVGAFTGRETFLHHFLPASVFLLLAGAWGLGALWKTGRLFLRILAVVVVVAFVAGFLYLLPLSVGGELPPEELAPRLYLTGVSSPR